MPRYFNAEFLILKREIYGNDLLLRAISPSEGNLALIVKNGANPNSRRGNMLDEGNLIAAKVYHKNHYYISEIELKENFSYLKTDLESIFYFRAILELLCQVYIYANKRFFYDVLKILKGCEKLVDREYTLFALIIKIFVIYDILKYPLICSISGQKITEGYTNGITFFALNRKPENKEFKKFSLLTKRSRFKFIRLLFATYFDTEFLKGIDL